MTTPEDPSWRDRADLTRPMSQEPTQYVDSGETQWLDPQEQPTVWQPQQQPTWEEQQRGVSPTPLEPVGKHVLIAVAIVVAVALVSVAVFFTMRHAGTGQAAPPPSPSAPPVPTFTSEPAATTTTTTERTTTTTSTADDPIAALASSPLSAATGTMPPSTCALPRFDLSDAKQAQFFSAAKKCADSAWGATLPGAGIPAATIKLVVVTGADGVQTSCGLIGPSDPSTQCQGTVYMTPAYLRDVQGNGRYPGKYFGTFLREYGHALQDVNGLTTLYTKAKSEPGADPADLDRRYQDQAICLAGIASGAMSGRGAVDGNITNEVRERITTGDPAPTDAGTWLDKGFSTRTLSACNTWTG